MRQEYATIRMPLPFEGLDHLSGNYPFARRNPLRQCFGNPVSSLRKRVKLSLLVLFDPCSMLAPHKHHVFKLSNIV